jgi:hypothetical protein
VFQSAVGRDNQYDLPANSTLFKALSRCLETIRSAAALICVQYVALQLPCDDYQTVINDLYSAMLVRKLRVSAVLSVSFSDVHPNCSEIINFTYDKKFE